jgi:hypothetical protein
MNCCDCVECLRRRNIKNLKEIATMHDTFTSQTDKLWLTIGELDILVEEMILKEEFQNASKGLSRGDFSRL